jgi:hypothetical protein
LNDGTAVELTGGHDVIFARRIEERLIGGVLSATGLIIWVDS